MKVKIKTWKRLKEEFGLDAEGDIDCKDSFLPEMEEMMPDDRIICLDDERYWHDYRIYQDMIEEIISE